MPVIEPVGQTAPANVLGQDFLLLRGCKAFLCFQLLQQSDGSHIVGVSLNGCAYTQGIVLNAEITAFGIRNGGQKHGRCSLISESGGWRGWQLLGVAFGRRGKLFVGKFREGIEVQTFQFPMNQIFQRIVFPLICKDTVHITIQAEIFQINIDLDRDFGVCDCGVSDGDCSHIGEVCRRLILAFTKFCDKPLSLFYAGFQTALDVGVHNHGYTLEGRVHIIDESMRNGFSLPVYIHDNLHGDTVEVFLPEILLHFLNIGIFNALADSAICVQIRNPADGQHFWFGCRLRGNFFRFLDGVKIPVIPCIGSQLLQELAPRHFLIE